MKLMPWFKLDSDEWLSSASLSGVSLAASGLWISYLCLMNRSPRRGFLLIGGKPPKPEDLARYLRRTPEEIITLTEELLRAGVGDRLREPRDSIPADTIYSPAMVRETAYLAKAKADGARGGNPQLKQRDA